MAVTVMLSVQVGADGVEPLVWVGTNPAWGQGTVQPSQADTSVEVYREVQNVLGSVLNFATALRRVA